MVLKPWSVREGKVVELRDDTDSSVIVRVEPPMEMPHLERLMAKHPRDLAAFFRINGIVSGKFSVEEVEAYVRVFATMRGASLITRPPAPDAEEALLPLLPMPATLAPKTPTAPVDMFRMPDHLYGKSTPYRNIPRAAAGLAYARLQEGPIGRRGLCESAGWAWQPGLAHGLLAAWRDLGVVEVVDPESSVYAYRAAFPKERLREFCKQRGFDITPEQVADRFWLPPEGGKAYLERLATEEPAFLIKHATKERWHVKDAVTLAPGPRVPEPQGFAASVGGQHIVPVKLPKAEEFHFEKKDVLCQLCGHHYAHAYVSRGLEVCGGCYQKPPINGKTTHGSERTMAER